MTRTKITDMELRIQVAGDLIHDPADLARELLRARVAMRKARRLISIAAYGHAKDTLNRALERVERKP